MSRLISTAGLAVGVALAVLGGCDPKTDEPTTSAGAATTEPSATPNTTSTGGIPSPGEGDSSTTVDDADDEDSESSTATGASSDGCRELAEAGWAGRQGRACGDLTLTVVPTDQPNMLIVLSVPPILGSPWDDDWEAHALYELPDRQVVARAARYAEPLSLDDDTLCDAAGALPDGALEIHDIEASLDVYLINREETGCIFSCDNVYADLTNATIACEDGPVPLGDPADDWYSPGDVPVHAYITLP